MNVLLGFSYYNSSGTWEVYLVGISLGQMDALMIGTDEGSVVGLSLVFPLGSPLDSPNPGADLSGTLLYAPLGLWFFSDVVWGVGIYFVPPSGSSIASKMNSVRYCQLVEILTLSL